MLNAADIQNISFLIQYIDKSKDRRAFHCFIDEVNEGFLLHDEGIHEDIAVRFRPVVRLDLIYALLAVEFENVAGTVFRISLFCAVIQERHIRTALDVLIDKSPEVSLEYPVARSNDDIILLHALDDIHVIVICTHIGVVNRVKTGILVKQKLQFAALCIDVVMLSIA